MLSYGFAKNNQDKRRPQQRSKKFNRLLVIIGMLLLLSICSVSAVNGTDVNTLHPPQTLNVTPLPVIQTLNVTTMLPTQTQVVAAVPPPVPVAKKATTVSTAAKVNAVNTQFNLKVGKRVTGTEGSRSRGLQKDSRGISLAGQPRNK